MADIRQNSLGAPATLELTGSLASAATAFTQDAIDYDLIQIQLVGNGTANEVLTWETSNDNTNWTAFPLVQVSSPYNSITAYTMAANGVVQLVGRIPGKYARLRCSTFTAGSVTYTVEFMALPGPDVEMPTYQPPATSATWTSGTSVNAAVTVNTSGYDSVALSVVNSAGTYTAGIITFEASDDNVTWFAIDVQRAAAPVRDLTYTLVTSDTRIWQRGTGSFAYVRVRLSTAITGTGSTVVKVTPSMDVYSPPGDMAGSDNFTSAHVTVTNSATTIVAARATRRRVIIVNYQTVPIYIGPATVTTTTGSRVDPYGVLELRPTSLIQGITAAAYTAAGEDDKVHYWEEYD